MRVSFMRKKIVLFIAVAAAMGAPVSGNANQTVIGEYELDPRIVFEIGGKAKIKQRRNRLIPVGAGVRWRTPMCNNYDMSFSVTNILNGVTGQLDKLGRDLLASVTGAISNWPMMELARADPQLYEFIQQGRLEASELFNASVASCEEMTDKMIREGYESGGSPGSWIYMSGFEDWSRSNPAQDDIVRVDETVNRNQGDSGVTWVGGKMAAGLNQPPIRVIADTTEAGAKLLSNQPVSSSSTRELPQGENSPWFSKYWATPEDAAKWVTDVVGETTLRTCVDCERLKTTPGKGVYAKLEEEQKRIEDRIVALLDSPLITYPQEELDKISAPGYGVTQQVLEALKGEVLYRQTLIERLAEEVATTDVVEKLIAARRILLSGLREAHIAQNPDAVRIITARINELGEEMNLLRQDAELRASTRQSVAVTILQRQSARSRATNSQAPDEMIEAIRAITGRN